MFRFPDTMSVADLRDIEKDNPQYPQYMHRMTSRSYADFTATLYREIYSIVNDIEHDANHMQEHGENALNADVCRQLRRCGYDAINDKNNRGHADITVEFANYTWIGEGKKVESANNTYLKKGYDQILDRYITGKASENQAALLVYIFAPDAKHVIGRWRQYLVEQDAKDPGYAQNIALCTVEPDHAFSSDAKHNSSGSTVTVRHIGFAMHWAPPK
jgi:hypothetical protein